VRSKRVKVGKSASTKTGTAKNNVNKLNTQKQEHINKETKDQQHGKTGIY